MVSADYLNHLRGLIARFKKVQLSRTALLGRLPWQGNKNPALCTGNTDINRFLKGNPTTQTGSNTIREKSHSTRIFIDPSLSKMSHSLDHFGLGKILATGNTSYQHRHRHWVSPDIKNTTSSKSLVKVPPLRIRANIKGKGSLNGFDLPNCSFADQPDNLCCLSRTPIHISLHEKNIIFTGCINDLLCFLQIHPYGLLTQDMFA